MKPAPAGPPLASGSALRECFAEMSPATWQPRFTFLAQHSRWPGSRRGRMDWGWVSEALYSPGGKRGFYLPLLWARGASPPERWLP